MINMEIELKSIKYLEDSNKNIDANIKDIPDYVIYWNNLTYQVYRAGIDKLIGHMKGERPVPKDVRTVLNGVCGSFSSNQMTALMGPSGAGKTTLLECLIGKRQLGLSGQIKVKRLDTNTGINLALVPQKSDFFDTLTVYETIFYSSKLKNNNYQDFNHDSTTNYVIKRLNLKLVSQSVVSSLSGSERKRLAIGIEIVSCPNLLVLDEPTTGLDSFAAEKVIHLLHSISRDKVGVIMTIHQPSWNIFRMFDKIFMLSPINQRCIYDGTPTDIIPYLVSKGLMSKPGMTPPDFITDIASGIMDAGPCINVNGVNVKMDAKNLLDSFSNEAENVFKKNVIISDEDADLISTLCAKSGGHVKAFNTLLKRELQNSFRNFSKFWILFLTAIFLPLLQLFQVNYIDNHSGCPINLDAIPIDMDAGSYVTYMADLKANLDNMLYVRRFIVLYTMGASFFASYVPLFFNQSEIQIIWREVKNSSYLSASYICAKYVADMIYLSSVVFTYSMLSYTFFGGNFDDYWRVLLFLTGQFIALDIMYSIGNVVSVCLRRSQLGTIIFIGELCLLPNVVFAGFLIATARSLDMSVIIDWLLFFRYPYYISMLAFGGFDACGDDVHARVEAIINSVNKFVYQYMSMTDMNMNIMNSTYNSYDTYEHVSTRASLYDVNNHKYENFMSRILKTPLNMSQTMTHIEKFGHILSGDAVGIFISPDGSVRSALMSYQYDHIDSDIGRLLCLGLIQVAIYRIAAYFALKRAIHEKF